MKKILIGASGSSTGFSIITSFRKYLGNSCKIITSDINKAELVTASIFSDGHLVLPYANSSEFLESLAGQIENLGITHYMPLLPEEVLAASKLKSRFNNIKIINANIEKSNAWVSKSIAANILEVHGINQPKLFKKEQLVDTNKYFVKPDCGVGSKNCFVKLGIEIKNDDVINDDFLIQEFCSGKEITVDCFYDGNNGFIRALARERLETKLGVCTKARIFFDDKIELLAKKIAKCFELSGTFCFQMMDESNWKVTDINPRPGGGTSMSAAVGNDFIGAMVLNLADLDYSQCFRELNKEIIVTRQYVDFQML